MTSLTGLPAICPDNGEWFYQLAACPFPMTDTVALKTRLLEEFKIEMPMVTWHGQTFVRISVQGYNTRDDMDALVDALAHCL